MQEVFKNIIEKLEKKVKTAKRIMVPEIHDELDRIANETAESFIEAYKESIEIIKQVAAEYNNGWIPCSERLPEEPKANPLFEGKNLELYLVTTEYGSNEQDKVYPFRAFWNGVNFTDGWHILDVIAWQPLPEPYRPKGE